MSSADSRLNTNPLVDPPAIVPSSVMNAANHPLPSSPSGLNASDLEISLPAESLRSPPGEAPAPLRSAIGLHLHPVDVLGRKQVLSSWGELSLLSRAATYDVDPHETDGELESDVGLDFPVPVRRGTVHKTPSQSKLQKEPSTVREAFATEAMAVVHEEPEEELEVPFVPSDLLRCDWWSKEFHAFLRSSWQIVWIVGRWILLTVPMGCIVGVVSAAFLWTVDGQSRSQKHARSGTTTLQCTVMYLIPPCSTMCSSCLSFDEGSF
jgi:hypothetical protein